MADAARPPAAEAVSATRRGDQDVDQVLVRRQAPGAPSDLAVTLLAAAAIVLPVLFYVRQHVQMLRYGYEIESLERQHAELATRRRELEAQRDRRLDYAKAESDARALGLAPVDPSRVYAAEGGPAPAAAASVASPLRSKAPGTAAAPAPPQPASVRAAAD